ncbi:MAG: hypothetical protein U0U67_02925 [Chitinophagales bacterium]
MQNSPSITFNTTIEDCPEFIDEISALTSAIMNENKPKQVFLIKINNWFDSKWLKFSGKVLGALGIWSYGNDIKIPPFHPNRVVFEKLFILNDLENYIETDLSFKIHLKQTSEENKRKIISISGNAIFIWYSSNSLKNQFGSFMLYKINEGRCEPFYLGFRKQDKWKIINHAGTNKKMMSYIINQGKNLSV